MSNKKKDPKKYYLRKFLNPQGQYTVAAVLAESKVEIGTYGNSVGIYNTLCIADCNRNINLELPCGDEEDIKSSMYKLNTLIEACQGIKAQIEVGRRLRLEAEAEEKRKKAEKAEKEKEPTNG